LLEDLADSHFVLTKWPLPPTMAQCEEILRALARFHAAWWDDPRLGVSLGGRGDAEATTSWLRKFEELLGRFKDRVGDVLPLERRDLFDRWLRAAPRLLADIIRDATSRSLTATHTFGMRFCRGKALATRFVSSIGTASISMSARGTSPMQWRCTGIPTGAG
jgi:hypothetical protein